MKRYIRVLYVMFFAVKICDFSYLKYQISSVIRADSILIVRFLIVSEFVTHSVFTSLIILESSLDSLQVLCFMIFHLSSS